MKKEPINVWQGDTVGKYLKNFNEYMVYHTGDTGIIIFWQIHSSYS
ncbi:hypothetical protein SAMN05192534_10569 [Alteribacillus persepolensis]|uniref:Uncharacterized protein n=1 Tax=Alteribacillus persepolensis TaxID=568899 RepID=A0A1G8C5S1_9BACI|nr:hypothetical protein SAMN05192534_10569 [Alteribacillus persepolensis]